MKVFHMIQELFPNPPGAVQPIHKNPRNHIPLQSHKALYLTVLFIYIDFCLQKQLTHHGNLFAPVIPGHKSMGIQIALQPKLHDTPGILGL